MSRVRWGPGFALALVGFTAWAGCGGSTELPGTGGAGGAASWAACDRPGQCLALTTGCCAPCGKPTLAGVTGVNEAREDAFRDDTCGEPNPACPKCATAREPNLVAFCENNVCTAHDIRQHAFSSCSADSDCALRYPECCEPCAADPFGLIALAQAHLGDYRDAVCKPMQACPACVPAYPPEYVARCGPDHHCAVVQTACPAGVPAFDAACQHEGAKCEYGNDVRIGCRTHATCTNGAWQVAISGCKPLPGLGEEGCPNALPWGSCNVEGLICDMGQDTVCVCGQCVGGPCSLEAHWACAGPPATPGCPALAPALGSACDSPDLSCLYGICATDTSAGRRCSDGYWQDEPIACPL